MTIVNGVYKWPEIWPDLPDYSKQFFENDPQAAYTYATEPVRAAGQTGYHGWLQRAGPRYQTAFANQLATGNIPLATTWYDWLTNPGTFDPYTDYLKSSPYERGERPGSFAGRARWVP